MALKPHSNTARHPWHALGKVKSRCQCMNGTPRLVAFRAPGRKIQNASSHLMWVCMLHGCNHPGMNHPIKLMRRLKRACTVSVCVLYCQTWGATLTVSLPSATDTGREEASKAELHLLCLWMGNTRIFLIHLTEVCCRVADGIYVQHLRIHAQAL